jgi:hypothetical protein
MVSGASKNRPPFLLREHGFWAIVLAQPTFKQMKLVGLALASLVVVAAFALGT